MNIYVARQPIFDKKRQVFAYELLFRDSMENYMPQVDGDSATSSVLSSSFLNMGLDSLSGGKTVFINFTRKLIVDLIPLMFPSKDTIVEILETIQPEEDVIAACHILRKNGFRLALDDYVFEPAMKDFLNVVDIVKVDFMAAPMDEIREKVKDLPRKITLLAEKIETWEEFRDAIAMGFTLFQGYFFCKPEIVKGREVPAGSMTLLEIMKEVNNLEIDFERITSRITRDVSISYKLLRYINSAFFKRIQEISTIKNALIYLGQNELRRFISVIIMANLASSGTPELAIASCVRGRFCELVGDRMAKPGMNQDLFTLGLFSLIDAILDQPMERIMENLPLSESLKDALVCEKGPLADILKVSVCFEKGDWDNVAAQCRKLNLDAGCLPGLYKDSVEWADALRSI
ncbi:MAG: HDOD domain-containing protein [Proteobacteria bacterium]|nr:HDOD domain-containing protein [Pseudomonadota bacterium]